MKLCSLALDLHFPQNFCHTHRHTDRHFPEIVKLCSGHTKTCKSIKNWKSKIFTKLILCLIYIEESKKGREWRNIIQIITSEKKKESFIFMLVTSIYTWLQ